MRIITIAIIGFVLGVTTTSAQIYLSPQIGFKAYGLNGAATENSAGQVTQLGVAKGSGTAFNAAVGFGYEIKFPAPIYRLDLEGNVSWSSINFFQNAYDNMQGAGSFAAAGYTGGGAEIFSLDLMPIHRLIIPGFFVSPYGGIGLALNLFDNTNTNAGPPSLPAGTIISGATDFQVGLSIFYGVYLNVLPGIEPFIQFKHLIPFSGSYQITTNVSEPGVGGRTDVITVQDAPGYFNLNAGVRFNF